MWAFVTLLLFHKLTKTMKFYGFFIIGICLHLAGAAQDSLQTSLQRFGGSGYFKIGYGAVATAGIPAILNSHSSFAPDVLSVGGGGFAYLNRVVIGGNGFGMVGSRRGDTLLTHGGGGFEFGYDLLNQTNRQFLATVMLGGRGTSINIDNDNDAPVLTSGSILAGINLQLLQYVFFTPKDAGEMGGVHVGLRLSVWTSFAGSTWERNGRKITGSGNYQPQGFMFSATFGGAGFGSRR